MRKIFILSIINIFLFTFHSNAQSIKLNSDSIYVDSQGIPYSGIYKEYFENGNIKIAMSLKDGVKNGITNIYFENGNLNEVYSYKNNQMDGQWLTFNNKNIKTAEANYSMDKKDGTWKIWDENGNLIYLMYFKDGKKVGTWIKYNEKGEEIAKKVY